MTDEQSTEALIAETANLAGILARCADGGYTRARIKAECAEAVSMLSRLTTRLASLSAQLGEPRPAHNANWSERVDAVIAAMREQNRLELAKLVEEGATRLAAGNAVFGWDLAGWERYAASRAGAMLSQEPRPAVGREITLDPNVRWRLQDSARRCAERVAWLGKYFDGGEITDEETRAAMRWYRQEGEDIHEALACIDALLARADQQGQPEDGR